MILLKLLLVENVMDNPEFRRWFGNSKVVDTHGNPLVVYHGTNADIKEFDFSKTTGIGMHFGTKEQSNYRYGTKINGNIIPCFLSIKNPIELPDHVWDNPITLAKGLAKYDTDGLLSKIATIYTHHKESKIDDNLPYEKYNDLAKKWDETRWKLKFEISKLSRDVLEKHGFDGIMYNNEVEGCGKSWIAFYPNQIKSAIGNMGSFNPDDSNITKENK